MSYGTHDLYEMSLGEIAEELYRRGLTDHLYSKSAIHNIECVALEKLKLFSEGKRIPKYNPIKLSKTKRTVKLQVVFPDGTKSKVFNSKKTLCEELAIPHGTLRSIELQKIGKTKNSKYYGWKINRL